VHIAFGLAGSAFALPTHAVAWHCVAAAQSVSFEHESALTTGASRPHFGKPGEADEVEAGALGATTALSVPPATLERGVLETGAAEPGEPEARELGGGSVDVGATAGGVPHPKSPRAPVEINPTKPSVAGTKRNEIMGEGVLRFGHGCKQKRVAPRPSVARDLDTWHVRAHHGSMSDPKKGSDPIEDIREGLGLLFRAARTAVEKLPTKDLEEAVVSGAKEVERAVKSVAEAVETQFSGMSAKRTSSASEAPPASTAKGPDASTDPPAVVTPPSPAPSTEGEDTTPSTDKD